MSKDLTDLFSPREMRNHDHYMKIDHSDRGEQNWDLFPAALGIAAIVLSFLIFIFFEPSTSEAENGYPIIERLSLAGTELEQSAKDFCDQVAIDWKGKHRPLSIRNVCGV